MHLKNILVGQSGGPTAAINATLAGVIDAGIKNRNIGTVYGTLNGIKGVISNNLINLSERFADEDAISILKQTPSAYLGSCRYKLEKDSKEIEKIINVLKENNIGFFFYIGGNDSMDTVLKLKEPCAKNGISVIGIPKTIDNDLALTDHCPGFGSAAKYIAVAVSEIICDAKCYSIESVTIIEIMGRNAGWLTASSALAGVNGLQQSPDLIYVPEVPFDVQKFLADVKQKVIEKKNIVVAVSEGIRSKDGKYIAEQNELFKEDLFGHSQLGGAGKVLEELVKKTYGIKVRSIELNTPQRCAAHLASKVDIDESFRIGKAALDAAFDGENGKMMIYKRISSNPYKISFDTIDIEKTANFEKKLPAEFIAESGSYVTDEFIEYAYPLIQGEPNIVYKNGIPIHAIL